MFVVCQRLGVTCAHGWCICVCVGGRGEESFGGELLLSWQGRVLIGTPSEWYECRCHNENSKGRPTLIHSYGEPPSPEGCEIRKTFTTLNTHASRSLTEHACAPRICPCLCSYLSTCAATLSVCQANSHR